MTSLALAADPLQRHKCIQGSSTCDITLSTVDNHFSMLATLGNGVAGPTVGSMKATPAQIQVVSLYKPVWLLLVVRSPASLMHRTALHCVQLLQQLM